MYELCLAWVKSCENLASISDDSSVCLSHSMLYTALEGLVLDMSNGEMRFQPKSNSKGVYPVESSLEELNTNSADDKKEPQLSWLSAQ